ncbi:hypothetical protein AWV80_33200 [Cupriavidus sp. UYMU48A]|nr:hypothetical protein AWV80_33200 [Cupriavidus sp. UYMU48A]
MASGSRPITMAPWLDGTSRMASDENTGKPTTTPSAVTASLAHCPPRGRRRASSAPRMPSSASASTAAITARASATKFASSSATAMRVNGSVWLKMATPIKPSNMPPECGGCEAEAWVRREVIVRVGCDGRIRASPDAR